MTDDTSALILTKLDAIAAQNVRIEAQNARLEAKQETIEDLLANYVQATGEDLDRVRSRLDRIERPTNGLNGGAHL